MSRRVRDDSLFDLRTGYWNGDLLAIFDETAGGVIEELDFRREAINAKTFGESIAWLGYARVPRRGTVVCPAVGGDPNQDQGDEVHDGDQDAAEQRDDARLKRFDTIQTV